MPIEVAAVGGVGDAGIILSAPIGVTLGVPIRGGAARFTPYVTPRIAGTLGDREAAAVGVAF